MATPYGKAKKRTPPPPRHEYAEVVDRLLADQADPLARIREAADHAAALLHDENATRQQRDYARTLVEMAKAATRHREAGNMDQAIRTAMQAQHAIDELFYNPLDGAKGLELRTVPIRLHGVYVVPSKPQVAHLLNRIAEGGEVSTEAAMRAIDTDNRNSLKTIVWAANQDIRRAGGQFTISQRGGTVHIKPRKK